MKVVCYKSPASRRRQECRYVGNFKVITSLCSFEITGIANIRRILVTSTPIKFKTKFIYRSIWPCGR